MQPDLYCGTAVLVKRSRDLDEIALVALHCRSWQCDQCAAMMKAEIKRRIREGKPNKFITLTCSPDVGASPEHRREMMARAWHTLTQRIKRKYGFDRFAYYVVVERTKRGEPHFHVAARAGWIDQAWLSNQWRELVGARIVDIRAVKTSRGVARYLAKYLGKDPADFPHKRRAWGTPGWRPRPEKPPSIFAGIDGWWDRLKLSFNQAAEIPVLAGLTIMAANGSWLYASTPERWQLRKPDIEARQAAKKVKPP